MREKPVRRTSAHTSLSGNFILKSGFTLIELSIVLVIIGLIIGGILVGADLINAAAIRSQISQIEKYNTAVNNFRNKYGYLPGDIPNPFATEFGFISRGTLSGTGDGNGVIEGHIGSPGTECGFCGGDGEATTFWVDLSTAGLIEGGFNTANPSSNPTPPVTGSNLALYYPTAKIGAGNYVNVWSGGTSLGWNTVTETGNNGVNYYSVSAITQLGTGGAAYPIGIANPGLTVVQAYNIDKKVDDGFPQSGSVTAFYLDFAGSPYTPIWAGSGNQTGSPYTTATSSSSTTCFDNGGVAGIMQYSMEQNGGSGVNCALSFRFQ